VFVRKLRARLSIIKISVVLHNFNRPREGLFCEGAENYAVDKKNHHISNDDDDGKQRLTGALDL
jgi:hypothetical protein